MSTTHWITTASGHTFDANDPRPSDIRAHDVAHALGHLCRFTGHTRRFYSVLEHSLFVLEIGRQRDHGYVLPKDLLALLLHDAPEAYINDLSTPVKALVGAGYRDVEAKYVRAVTERFGLEPDAFEATRVKQADASALKIEAWELLPDRGVTGGINRPGYAPREVVLTTDEVPRNVPDVNELRLRFLAEIITLTERNTL